MSISGTRFRLNRMDGDDTPRWFCSGFDAFLSAGVFVKRDVPVNFLHPQGVNRVCDDMYRDLLMENMSGEAWYYARYDKGRNPCTVDRRCLSSREHRETRPMGIYKARFKNSFYSPCTSYT